MDKRQKMWEAAAKVLMDFRAAETRMLRSNQVRQKMEVPLAGCVNWISVKSSQLLLWWVRLLLLLWLMVEFDTLLDVRRSYHICNKRRRATTVPDIICTEQHLAENSISSKSKSLVLQRKCHVGVNKQIYMALLDAKMSDF